MTSPAPVTTVITPDAAPAQDFAEREGRFWDVTFLTEPTTTVFGRLKVADPVGWIMIIDADAAGENFVALAAPAAQIVSVELSDNQIA